MALIVVESKLLVLSQQDTVLQLLAAITALAVADTIFFHERIGVGFMLFFTVLKKSWSSTVDDRELFTCCQPKEMSVWEEIKHSFET